MLLLRLRNIKKSFGSLDVLNDISLDIKDNAKMGLVGDNGSGKTTLAKILLGEIHQDSGLYDTFNRSIKVSYLKQSSEYNNTEFTNYLGKDPINIKDILQTSSQLGLKNFKDWPEEQLENLSGGEKTKIAITKVFNEKCDLLILDEPTNHLDYVGVEWLINEIKKLPYAILVISHDRYFLDQVVDEIAEIEDGKITMYNGNYSDYRKQKDERYQSQLQQYQDQKKKEKHIDEEISRLKKWSYSANKDSTKKEGFKEYWRMKSKKKDRQVKSTVKRLEKMREEGVKKPKAESSLTFDFTLADKTGLTLVSANSLTKNFKNKILFQNSRFYIKRGEKVGLIGINGSGKTTLIKMILGEDLNYQGNLSISSSSKIAYLSQDVLDLDENKSILEMLSDFDKDYQSIARTYLASNGISSRMLEQKISTLSLGERTRIKIIFLILQENNVLILDEPTNHLDLHSREQLESTLNSYNGTIIIASHDRYLLEKITDKLLIFENGKIIRKEVGYKEYNELKEETKNNDDKTYEIMKIQNQITFILAELNKYKPTDAAYLKLDSEFNELIKLKNKIEKNN